jgi:signal transduction histidine kinase
VGTLDGEPNPRPGWSTRRGPSHKSDLAVLTMPVGDAHLLSIAGSPSSIREVEGALLETFGWVLAATLLIGLAGGAFLSSRFLDRVDGIAGAVRAIIAGDYRERMPIRGTEDELDRLAETLNVMLDRIGGLMDSLRQVSNDIAHDLRTPLSRLRQRLELALATTRSEEKLREAVTEAIADTDDILATFSALLRIAQIEAGTRKAGFASVDLSQVVSDVAQAYAPTIEDEGKRLHVAVEPDIAQTGDRELLTQLVANLIENAMRHTPEGTDITVSLTSQPTGAMLVVADNGPGVPPEAFDQLFRRFYRLECSRTTPGSGLGLSLVKAICDLHSATATLRDNAPGLRVEVVLPDLRRRRA